MAVLDDVTDAEFGAANAHGSLEFNLGTPEKPCNPLFGAGRAEFRRAACAVPGRRLECSASSAFSISAKKSSTEKLSPSRFPGRADLGSLAMGFDSISGTGIRLSDP